MGRSRDAHFATRLVAQPLFLSRPLFLPPTVLVTHRSCRPLFWSPIVLVATAALVAHYSCHPPFLSPQSPNVAHCSITHCSCRPLSPTVLVTHCRPVFWSPTVSHCSIALVLAANRSCHPPFLSPTVQSPIVFAAHRSCHPLSPTVLIANCSCRAYCCRPLFSLVLPCSFMTSVCYCSSG